MNIAAISPMELYRLRQQGQAIDLIDVRSGLEYRAGHVEGATWLPLQQVTAEAVQAVRRGRESDPIYVICHSGGRSQAACNRLAAAGMAQVVNVEGGTAAWKSAGLPIAREPGAWRQYVRAAGLVLVVLALVLGFTVHAYFSIAAAVVWIGLIVVGGGSCPLMCQSPSASTDRSENCCTK